MGESYLELVTPQGEATKIPLEGGQPLTIGRHPTNRLPLTDGEASRFHCIIETYNGGYRVKDLESRNGTKLNGAPVKLSMLAPGDVVTIGQTALKFVSADAPKTQGPPGGAPGRASSAPVFDQVDLELDESGADPEGSLKRIADSLPDKSFNEMDISMLNARGEVVHAAQSGNSRNRSQDGKETVNLFRLLLLVCFRLRATDIHVEPKSDGTSVRLRVDGNMIDILRVPREIASRLVVVVKILCDIDIAHRNAVQEGHFTVMLPDRRVDYRISFAPSVYGQKLVIRILDTAAGPRYIWDLQLPQWMFEVVEQAVQLDSGMVLTCGPKGSGKTTTLYALVRSMDVSQRNVTTIEDPVEIQIDGITQIPVSDEQGNSFANLLRSVLRQDPDAIMVGEIRDSETATTAMRAAMTGHLVFSTVHSRDTVGTIFRLLDLGIEPFLVSSGLHLVVAQRLVRQLCQFCKAPVKPTAGQLAKFGDKAANLKELFAARGCPRCLKTGFLGRRAIFELLVNSPELRELLLKKPTPGDIHKLLAATPFQRLMDIGYQMAVEGATTMEEVERAVGQT